MQNYQKKLLKNTSNKPFLVKKSEQNSNEKYE